MMFDVMLPYTLFTYSTKTLSHVFSTITSTTVLVTIPLCRKHRSLYRMCNRKNVSMMFDVMVPVHTVHLLNKNFLTCCFYYYIDHPISNHATLSSTI